MVCFTKCLLTTAFRRSFRIPDKVTLQWFPGHMNKGMKQMQQKLKSVDCLIEVHDARVPLSGRNPNFYRSLGRTKPHILVFNKKDMIEPSSLRLVKSQFEKDGISNVLFTNCKDSSCSGARKIVPLAIDLISKSDRFNRAEERSYCIMVIGVPNVGKSSLINFLRNKYLKKSKAAAVGAIAGITRSVTTQIKVSEHPTIYVLDTPGILTPSVPDTETGMKLALCSCLQDHLVGVELMADYLLYWLNKNQNFKYVKLLELDGPIDNITEFLVLAAVKMNYMRTVKRLDGSSELIPDTSTAATEMIKAFRNGEFGKLILDYDRLRK